MRQYLKQLRQNKQYTQEQVANHLNMSQQMYGFIENGNRQKRMDIQIASKLAAVFGVPLEIILNEESKWQLNAS